MRSLARMLAVVGAILLMPAAGWAQEASVAGVVTDASGGVLPGVTVEASSPALIERVRSVITDGTGQYRIVALPPGNYTITYSLPGFTTVRREGVQLSGALSATFNVELRVGALEETVTVTGEAPLVDVRSARRQQVIDGEVLNTLPTSRSYNDVLQLVPGVVAGNGQVQLRPTMLLFSAHGGNAEDGRLTLDGINTGASRGGAGVSGYIPDMTNVSEVTFSISGNLGEAETGGPQMTIVPRSGGNRLSGGFLVSGLNESMQGQNFDADQLRVLSAPAPTLLLRDYQASLGGPVMRDRLWFFGNHRRVDAHDAQPGIFANRNAGDPNSWLYQPDFSRQGRIDDKRMIYALRLTGQMTPKNKLMVFWDEQPRCAGSAWPGSGVDKCHKVKDGWIHGGSQVNGFFGAGPNSPETGDYQDTHQRVQQVKYTGTATNRLLLEAGFGTYLSQWGYEERPGNPTRDLVRVQEQSAQIFDRNGNRLTDAAQIQACQDCLTVGGNLKYRSSNEPTGYIFAHTWNASASYVTGAHSMKFGYQGAYHRDDDNLFNVISNVHRMQYRFNNGVPNQVTIQAGHWTRKARTEYAAFFAQEQWTRNRLTVQGALRYDRAWSHFPEQVIGPDVFIPTALVVPADRGVTGYNDLSPRVGMAYDVFGTGKTSFKANIGRYLHPASNSGRFVASNPSERMVTIVNRTWNDRNGNYWPDCNLLNGADQNPATLPGNVPNPSFNPALDSCGVWSDPNYGQARPTTSLDPAILSGWGTRPYDWQFGISMQQELLPRVSAEVGYYRRWWPIWSGADVTDNILVAPSDFGQFSVTAPNDPRLPDGGGYTVSNLYNINPDAAGRAESVRRSANAYGDYKRYWDGFDVTVQARLANGLTMQGGTSTGRTVEDDCAVRPQVPENSPLNPYCRSVEPLRTQFKGLASYTVPLVDVQVSSTFSSRPGISLSANQIYTSPQVEQSLGRPLAVVTNVTVNLLEPNTVFGDRINQLDLRIGKNLRFGRTRTNVSLDVVNALNSNANIGYSPTFSPTWPTPTAVLLPRLLRVTAGIDF